MLKQVEMNQMVMVNGKDSSEEEQETSQERKARIQKYREQREQELKLKQE
jgi:hypothetical protein